MRCDRRTEAVGVHDSGDLIVGVQGQKLRLELVALGNVDSVIDIRQAQLLEGNSNLHSTKGQTNVSNLVIGQYKKANSGARSEVKCRPAAAAGLPAVGWAGLGWTETGEKKKAGAFRLHSVARCNDIPCKSNAWPPRCGRANAARVACGVLGRSQCVGLNGLLLAHFAASAKKSGSCKNLTYKIFCLDTRAKIAPIKFANRTCSWRNGALASCVLVRERT